jgi:23S rRNA G2069 N7-methylase RlmK/C1962 C5-methylase RlmI
MERLAEGDDWVAFEVAEAGGFAANEGLHAVSEPGSEVAGIALFARSPEARERLLAALAATPGALTYHAVVRTPPWSDGRLEEPYAGRPAATEFEIVETRGPASLLALRPNSGDPKQVRFHLARAGQPIAGDTRRGGVKVAGGLRLRIARIVLKDAGVDVAAPTPEEFWPVESLGIPEQPRPTLTVSNATAGALRRGHPWVIADADTSEVETLPAGVLVDVRSVRGDMAGLARIEGHGRVAARRWSKSAKRGQVDSVEARIARALERRRALIADDETDCYRLAHGEADGLPGLAIDRFGPALRVLFSGRACEPIAERVLNAVIHHLATELGPDPPVVRTLHLADPPAGRLRGVELVRGSLDGLQDDEGRLEVRERGLRFTVDLGLTEPYRPRPGTGLFLDQRENRARVARLAEGGRWLNLFAHTGAFSAAALAGGARECVSVDLSAPYLAWLESNLARNGLAGARHRIVRSDARRYLERLGRGESFDGIMFDPPTAARAGRRFWSVRREGGELLAECLQRLAPGGRLLACRNDHGARESLASLVEAIALEHGIALTGIEGAPPGVDFPKLAGFPEGVAFDGAIATRA